MESYVPLQSSYLQMSQSQDRLRWDCFVEGRISALLLECIRPLFVQWTPQKSLEKWGTQILKTLLNLTHKQWIFRNADVHYKINGLTQEQHMEIFSCIQSLMEITPLDLLPCHCHLLDNSFHNLGNAETIHQQIWIALMETALKAASRATAGQIKPGSMTIFNNHCLTAIPRRSTNHHSQTTTRPHPDPQCQPHQQTLLASFWIPPLVPPGTTSPPKSHNTDLTGTHYRLHWRRK
jgi:hypothetical protein